MKNLHISDDDRAYLASIGVTTLEQCAELVDPRFPPALLSDPSVGSLLNIDARRLLHVYAQRKIADERGAKARAAHVARRMTVGDLIAALARFDKDKLVTFESYAQGASFKLYVTAAHAEDGRVELEGEQEP